MCGVLEIAQPIRVAERLDTDEVNQTPVTDNLGRKQNTYIINESGLYNVILRSDKPAAKPFRKWVKTLVLTNKKQEKMLEEAKPKVAYYDIILQNKDAIPIGTIAKD